MQPLCRMPLSAPPFQGAEKRPFKRLSLGVDFALKDPVFFQKS
jgi:hypothetical protein